MLYESVRLAYSCVLDVIHHFSSESSSAFFPSYAFAGISRLGETNFGGLNLSRIATYMGRHRFHKSHANPQYLKQQALKNIPVARNRRQREYIPNSVVGEDGEKHHINRYRKPKEVVVELSTKGNLVRETLEAIATSCGD